MSIELVHAYWHGRSLSAAEIEWFAAREVTATQIAGADLADMVLADHVVPQGSRFEFAADRTDEEAVEAFTLLAGDEAGDPVDIVAWAPATQWMGSWLGHAAVLGAEQLWAPRLGALEVHADPASWLRADRHGIVIVDPARAPALLRDVGELRAEDEAFGRMLRECLTYRPKVLVPSKSRRAA